MRLTQEQVSEIGQDEESRWQRSFEAIKRETARTTEDYHRDRKLARELTSELVAARRDEDKWQLASDEAIAHGLTKLRHQKTKKLDDLLDQPYFARVITEENGRQIEFRLGTASFPSERIIDWRQAPISKLYYDYKEGDEFEEDIQGRVREGVIKLRRSFQGKDNLLKLIETANGSLFKTAEGWKCFDEDSGQSRKPGHDAHLPSILTLITPEQFRLITKDAHKPLVIQGIAGSGKTTVALHRLAWLLHEANSQAKAENVLVVMLNPVLKSYVETTLPELNIHQVKIKTFQEWSHAILDEVVGKRISMTHPHWRVENFKTSMDCLILMKNYVDGHRETMGDDLLKEYFQFLGFLRTQPVSAEIKFVLDAHLEKQLQTHHLSPADETLLLNFIHELKGVYPVKGAQLANDLDHILIDEAQDFGQGEIQALLRALYEDRSVTIVGDTAQKISMDKNFESWEKVLVDSGFKEIHPLTLTVSHRTTREILEIANYVREPDANSADREISAKSGPIPHFVRVDHAGNLALHIAQWIRTQMEIGKHTFNAVICRTDQFAEKLYHELRQMGLTSLRLGTLRNFDFSPGVVITSVSEVKGLEFRNVLIVEPSAENYRPGHLDERNFLYVAITRAELGLDFIGCAEPSQLLPELPSTDSFQPNEPETDRTLPSDWDEVE